MADVDIRVARAEDDKVLSEMDYRCWSTVSAVMPRPAPDRPFFSEKSRPSDLRVPVVDGKVAGYLRLVPASPLRSTAHVWQIRGLLVDEWARGMGVGRALLEAACEETRQRGGRRLTLHLLGHNTAARRLYERTGFVVEGVLPGEMLLDGVYVDDVLMGRRVDLDA
jgi:ribosomal protein S18 acetylase RimI-like enzyme